jgi:S1-C subfamily serine protease
MFERRPRTLPRRPPALALAAALLLAAPVAAQTRADIGATWCYDPERDALSRALPGACAGRLVDDAEAARLRDSRADRVRGIIGDTRPRATPGNPQPFSTAPSEPRAARPAPPAGGGGRQEAGPRAEPVAPALPPRPPATTQGRIAKSSGTGFFINETGAILTNFHVVASCGVLTVSGYDRNPVEARVTATASAIDLAVLQAPIVPPAVATFSRDPGKAPSDRAVVVGFSLQGQPTTTATLTSVKARQDLLTTEQWRFAFDGKAFPGHSGSPLLNEFGEVVGVVHARAVDRIASTQPNVGETRFGIAVSLRAARQFLGDSKVSVIPGDADRSFSDLQILERARRFVVRVQCWS